MRYETLGLSLLATCLLSFPALAQSTEGEDGQRRRDTAGRPRMVEIRERMIAEFDKDGDGGLNEEEREAMQNAMRERRDGGDDRRSQAEAGRGGEGRGADISGPDGERGRDGRRGPLGERRRGPDGARGDDERNRVEADRDQTGRRPDRPRRLGGPAGERRGPGDRGVGRRRGPMGPMGGPPELLLEPLFVWFDANGDNALSRAEFAELSEFVRRHRPGQPRGPERGPRTGRRGSDGPRPDERVREEIERPRERGREIRERGPRPEGPARDGDERRERRGRDERGPRGDGPPPRPDRPAEDVI